jgi:hypothetical protein
MTSQTSPVWNHKVTYHPEPTRLRDRVSNDYYWVALPDKIEKIGFKADQCLELEKHEEGELAYIRGVAGDMEKCESRKQEHSNFRKIFEHSGNTWLSIPVEWIDNFIENRGDELLIVEINEVEEEPHIRVYKNEDYNGHRIAELQDQGNTPISGAPVVVALTADEEGDEEDEDEGESIADEAYELVSASSYEVDKFDIIPFDAQDEVFGKPALDYEWVVSPEATVKADEMYGLSEFEVDKMWIEWQPPSSTKDFEEGDRTIYTDSNSSVFRVKLPRHGLYRINAKSGDREGSVLLNYGSPKQYSQNENEALQMPPRIIDESLLPKSIDRAVELADILQPSLETFQELQNQALEKPGTYYEDLFGESGRDIEVNFTDRWRGLYTFTDGEIYRNYLPVRSLPAAGGSILHWPTQSPRLHKNGVPVGGPHIS